MPITYGYGQGISISSGSLNNSGSIESSSVQLRIQSTGSKGNNLLFLIPSQSTGGDEDTIALFITSSGKNPFLGVGTSDPKSSLDVKDVEDSEVGTRFLLTSARTSTLGAQVGDSAGQIFFSIDSGSYNDPFTTGSVAALKTVITSLETTGSGQSANNSSGVFRIDASPVNDNELYNVVQIGFFSGSAFDYQGDTYGSATVHISGSLIIHPNPDDTGQQQGDIVPFEIWNRPTISTGVESLQLYLTGSNLVLTTGSFTANKITGSVEIVAGDLLLSNNTISSTLDSDVYFTIATNGIGFEANTGDTFQFNSVQNNVDFILSGENDQNLLFGDASADRIGIGTNTPNSKFEVVGDTILSGSLAVSQSFTASGLNYPNTDGLDRQVIKTDGLGNLSFGYAENVEIAIKNVSGGTINKGTPCFITASGTSGNVAGVIPADAGDLTKMPAGVVAGETILDEAEGLGLVSGFIQGVDTSTFTSGDTVYVAVGGGYTNVKPTGSGAFIQKLGNVEKVDALNGSGVINGPGYYNDLPNWEEGKIQVGTSTYPVTSSVISLDETNKYVSGSESAKFKLDAYAFGYNTFPGFGFDVTGSGIIVSSSLPDEHYPMVKIGETELLDLTTDTALSDHTFTIHNVDNFQVTSGSEPTEINTNKLFEHTGNAFNVYTGGSTTKVIDASSTSVKFGATDLYLAPSSTTYLKASSTSTPQYVAAWNSEPNVAGIGAALRYVTASTFTGGGGSSTPYSLGVFGGEYNWGTTDGGTTVAHGFVNGPQAGATVNTDHWINSAVYTPDSTTYSMSTYKMQYAALYSPVGGIPHIKGWGRTSDSVLTTNHSMSLSLWSLDTEPANLAAGSQTLTLRAQSEFLTFNGGTINYLGNGWEASGSSARPAGTFYFVTWDLGGPNPTATADFKANFTIWIEPS